ncbi:response regulator [Ruminiclostridium cellobioparum]|uniref:Stage 0 sporulation protein A homolog n=1 Tax=Ruminiclostridium cellobioparum subsp. termitidis CT1112 TaxID=1195236 RepID=S0FW54_RUMCE|nr:response regulator [Ruminiclostridium cellobioparum]EMS73394.1 two component transcriptional regulator, AraC family protein [Ruminiclostridium cellobioparum subsp. termitidis CT1112]
MNLNIMLVDDEPKVLRGLRSMIERSGEDWYIAGEYKNGVEALAAVINQKPDVIITDIKMPCMDGLELVQRAREITPDIKFIILSGFPDFSYAQKAIRLETVDYILKPPDYRDIMSSLKKIEQMLMERDSKIKEEGELKLFKEKALLQLKDKFFMDMLYETAPGHSPKKVPENECFYKTFALFIIRLDNFSISVFHETEEEMDMLSANRQKVQASVYKRGGCIVDLFDGSFCCLLNQTHESPAYIKTVAGEIHRELLESGLDSITIGISKCYSSPDRINAAFKECLYILRNKVFYEKNSIILFDELNVEKSSAEYPLDTEHKYIEALQFADFDKAVGILTELVDKVAEISNMDPIKFKSHIMEFVIVVMHNLFKDRFIEKMKFPTTNEMYKMLSRLDNKNDIQDMLITYTREISEYFNEKNKTACRKVISDIKSYINTNYFNDITLRQIAREFYMNESYLSDLFKKETGESFSMYLSTVRIDQSKVLLMQVDLKTQDIAEMVGYANSRYFIKVFRKLTGMSPSEYRERILNNG